MFDLRRATVIGALLTTLALTAAACGGSTAATAPPTPTPATGTEATPTPATGTEATPTPATEGTPDAAALPSFDLSALSGSIPGVDSYRTETSLGGVKQYESVVVTQPVLSKAITIYDDSGDVSQRFIVIGDEVWTADGADGAFQADTTGLGKTMLLAFDPALMLGAWTNVDWATAGANLGVEEKNGVQAHHLKIDSTTFVGASAQMPAGSAIDIWAADAGYLIAWEMSGFPEDANFSIQVLGVNDPANKVDRPS
jgi:hypothetical protein